jgi:hypothetical protein
MDVGGCVWMYLDVCPSCVCALGHAVKSCKSYVMHVRKMQRPVLFVVACEHVRWCKRCECVWCVVFGGAAFVNVGVCVGVCV